MAINLKALVSWGLLGEAGGSYTQVINEMEVIVSDAAPLAVSLSTAEISVELREGQ